MLTIKDIRDIEIKKVIELYNHHFEGKDLLEIGSGKGTILQFFKTICKSAKGVDIEGGSCSKDLVDDIIYYDGHKLPFKDNSFDVIFSSSVLEHIPHLKDLEKEFQRVLKKNGVAIHILPTSTWRVFTLIKHYIVLPIYIFMFIVRRLNFIKRSSIKVPGHDSPQVVKHTPLSLIADTLMARRHGEKGNRVTEIYYFSNTYWLKHFKKCQWNNIDITPTGIFYSNYNIGLNKKTHIKLAKVFGSGTNILKMEK